MLIYVPINQIDDNPFQARQEYGDIADLAARIAAAAGSYPDTFGLMQVPRGRLLFRTAAEERVLNTEQIAKFGVDEHLINDEAMRVLFLAITAARPGRQCVMFCMVMVLLLRMGGCE